MTYQTDIENMLEQRRNAVVWSQAGVDIGVNYALTLSPDFYHVDKTTGVGRLNGICKDLFQALNHELLGMTKAQVLRKRGVEFIGTYELRNKNDLIYPHAHIALRWDRDPLPLEVFMAEHWGVDIKGDWKPALGEPIRRLGKRPQWALKPINNMPGWMRYLQKQIQVDVQGLEVFPDQFIRKQR